MIMSAIYFIAACILAIEGRDMLAITCLICSTAYDIYDGLKEGKRNE